MGEEIQQAIQASESNDNVRAIVLRGSGKYFCTGMDLSGTNQSNLEEDIKSGVAANRSFQIFQSLKNCSKLTIAVLNGPAYGGGCGLFFACDIRFAHADAFLCFSEVKRGI